MKGKPDEETCEGCGFEWSMSLDEAILLVAGAPERYSRFMASGVGRTSDDPTDWSATGYLSHVVDVIRLGTERLWTLTLADRSEIPGWDEEALAATRRYEELSAVVGFRALDAAVRDWVAAARETPRTAEVTHPVFGPLSTDDAILRNAHEVQHHGRDIERALVEAPEI